MFPRYRLKPNPEGHIGNGKYADRVIFIGAVEDDIFAEHGFRFYVDAESEGEQPGRVKRGLPLGAEPSLEEAEYFLFNTPRIFPGLVSVERDLALTY